MRLHPTGQFDNHPAANRHIQVQPLAAAMGAEIIGVDASKINDAQFEETRAALFRHKMIYLRGQKLSHSDHEAFSLRFGPFAEDAYTQGLPGHRNVHPVIKEADDKRKAQRGTAKFDPVTVEPPFITALRTMVSLASQPRSERDAFMEIQEGR